LLWRTAAFGHIFTRNFRKQFSVATLGRELLSGALLGTALGTGFVAVESSSGADSGTSFGEQWGAALQTAFWSNCAAQLCASSSRWRFLGTIFGAQLWETPLGSTFYTFW
jgi:hypothetical protein